MILKYSDVVIIIFIVTPPLKYMGGGLVEQAGIWWGGLIELIFAVILDIL